MTLKKLKVRASILAKKLVRDGATISAMYDLNPFSDELKGHKYYKQLSACFLDSFKSEFYFRTDSKF